jgi:hypothetical protein
MGINLYNYSAPVSSGAKSKLLERPGIIVEGHQYGCIAKLVNRRFDPHRWQIFFTSYSII